MLLYFIMKLLALHYVLQLINRLLTMIRYYLLSYRYNRCAIIRNLLQIYLIPTTEKEYKRVKRVTWGCIGGL